MIIGGRTPPKYNQTVVEQVMSLKEVGLLYERDDGVVEPTDTALHASRLLID